MTAMNRAQRRAAEKAQKPSKPNPAMAAKYREQLRGYLEAQQLVELAQNAQWMLQEYPEDAELWYLAGRAYQLLGHLNEAVGYYQRALTQDASHAESLFQLAVITDKLGNLEQAVELLYSVLVHQPGHEEALRNLLYVLPRTNRNEQAVEIATQAVIHHPQQHAFWKSLLDVIGAVPDFKPSSRLLDFLARCSDDVVKGVHYYAAVAAYCLMTGYPALQEWTQTAESKAWGVLDNPLLITLLERSLVTQLYFEYFTLNLRGACLKALAENDETTLAQIPRALWTALPHYFFRGEYVAGMPEGDAAWLAAIGSQLQQIGGLDEHRRRLIGIWACYRPLTTLPELAHWRALARKSGDKALDALFVRMVDEPAEEARIAAEIPGFGIADGTSQNVQQQYEESPYPRWEYVPSMQAYTPRGFVGELCGAGFANALDIRVPDKKQEILIAGCGTGFQTMAVRRWYPTAKITNVDLSRSSIAYAMRKSRQMGLWDAGMEFYHGDILELEKLGRQFDMIESVGVLHHMQDPMAGWRVLERLLRPGGLMKIGLYSKVARTDIISVKEQLIAEGRFPHTVEEVVAQRQKLLAEGRAVAFQQTNDFYTTSEFRDLLFHVQEHQFTIPQIQQCIDELGLRFLGFLSNDFTLAARFNEVHPHGADRMDLANWQLVEEVHPGSFIGMYQFMLYKPA